jgi:predicted dehydrogenase
MPIGIGFLGYGYWGPNLVRNFWVNPGCQVVAVSDPRPNMRKAVIETFPRVDTYADSDDLLARKDIDAVVIATPVATHYPLACKALDRGKHVLIEKPMCQSTAEAEDLIERARRYERVLMVDHTFLFTGAVQTIARIIRRGELGRICYFDTMRVNLGLFQPDVNCLWDLAPHDLSIVDYLIEDEVVAIDATGYCHVKNGIPDMVFMTLHYASDWVFHLNLSWMSPVKIRRTTIGGTSKMLIWDDLDQDQKIKIYDHGIEIHGDEERSLIVPEYRIGDIHSPRVPLNEEALAGVADHFIKVIVGEVQCIMDGSKGLRVVQLLEVAQRQLDKSFAHIAAQRAAATRLKRAMSA